MLSEDFEVFYYSDRDFKSVGSHSHDYYEFYFFVEGAVSMELGGKTLRLREGDMLLVPPGVEHRAVMLDGSVPYRRFVFWASRDYVRKLMGISPDYGWIFQTAVTGHDYLTHLDAVEFNTVKSKLFTLLDEINSGRFAREPRIALLTQDLILWLSRELYERRHPLEKRESVSYYDAVSSFIELHLDEELTLDRLAGEFYISKFYISHLFQERTGLSVHRYIIKKRLSTALDAIRSGVSAAEAGRLSGFKDYSVFYRAFKKEYGVSPAEAKKI